MFVSYYLKHPTIDWTCPSCEINFLSDSLFDETQTQIEVNNQTDRNTTYANDLAGNISITSQTTDNNSFLSDLKELTTKLNLSLKDLKIAHLNICSLRNKIDELRYLQETCQFDIIAITESHLDAAVVNTQIAIRFKARSIRSYRTKRGGGGGAAYFITRRT